MYIYTYTCLYTHSFYLNLNQAIVRLLASKTPNNNPVRKGRPSLPPHHPEDRGVRGGGFNTGLPSGHPRQSRAELRRLYLGHKEARVREGENERKGLRGSADEPRPIEPLRGSHRPSTALPALTCYESGRPRGFAGETT